MSALSRHLDNVESEKISRMRKAYEKPSTQESRKACTDFLRESKKNPMLTPSPEAKEEIDRQLYKILYADLTSDFSTSQTN